LISKNIQRIAAFSDAGQGGNPAGVLITDAHPATDEMCRIAAEVGYSETAFAMPQDDGWRVRYFSPACAATAAFAGYLRDINWPHGGSIEIVQGEDMGIRSRLKADIPPEPGSSIRVSGSARIMEI